MRIFNTVLQGNLRHFLLGSCAVLAATPALAQSSGSTQLQTIVVDAEAVGEGSGAGDGVTASGDNATGPVDGIVATRSATATKTGTPILETPQTINVITAEEMREQAVTSTAEALRYTPGITPESFGSDPRTNWIRSRGFQVPEFLDGMRLPRGVYAWQLIDPYLLERLEVLKGPSAGLYGQTPPGGLVNMVSKRPTKETLREVFVQTGDPGHVQAGFDFGGALSPDGAWSYRLTGLGQLGDTEVDFVNDDRLAIAPSVTWTPTANTSLTLLGKYITRDSKSLQFLPASGTAFDNPNGVIPTERFVGEPDFDNFDFEQYSFGYLFEHAFENGVTLNHKLRYGNIDYDLDVVRTHPAFGLAADGRTLNRIAARIQDETGALTSDTNLHTKLQTGALSHDLVAGVDYITQDTDYRFGVAQIDTIDVFDPQYGASPGAFTFNTDQDQSLDQLGIYVQDQISFGGFRLMLTGRHDWADTETYNNNNGTTVSSSDSAFTGRAGLLYAFSNGVAPYVSYSTSFEPLTGTSTNGSPLEPTKGTQYEVGVKYAPPGTNALFTVAAFDLTQSNVLNTYMNGGVQQREQIGKSRVRGIELEARVDLRNGVELIAGYAYQDSEITEAADGTQGNRLAYVPEHQASVWANYTFATGAFEGVTIGGGVRYHGASFGSPNNAIETDGYTLVDASASYDFGALDPKYEGLKLAINAANLLDERYVASCNSANACYYGSSRTIRGTLSYRW